jgi:hypothetical protein
VIETPADSDALQIQELVLRVVAQIASAEGAGRINFWHGHHDPRFKQESRGLVVWGSPQSVWMSVASDMAGADQCAMKMRVLALEIILGAAASASEKVPSFRTFPLNAAGPDNEILYHTTFLLR